MSDKPVGWENCEVHFHLMPDGRCTCVLPQPVDRSAFVMRILRLFQFDGPDPLWWREGTGAAQDDKELHFFIQCNDFFVWGCADAVEVTPENIDVLAQSLEDVRELDERKWPDLHTGGLLFCARDQKMRPQGAFYPHLPVPTWHLFDACGPEREVGPGNPKARPAEPVAT